MLLPALLLSHCLHHLQITYLRTQVEYLRLYLFVLLPQPFYFLLDGFPVGRRFVGGVVGVPQYVILVARNGVGG